ncbi:MAG: hypothetical protein HY903_14585 [Deltaproteobacteria bacterium]|nr:hypothetical protein [Deltaproteobacteria bacterium]
MSYLERARLVAKPERRALAVLLLSDLVDELHELAALHPGRRSAAVTAIAQHLSAAQDLLDPPADVGTLMSAIEHEPGAARAIAAELAALVAAQDVHGR